MRREHEAYQQEAQQPKKSRKYLAISILAIVILLFAGIGGWLYMNRPNNPLPKNVTDSAGFPVYYPSTMPKGYTFDSTSPKASSGLLIYSLKDSSNKAPITLTLQPVPNGFNVAKVFDPKITPATNIPIGNEYNLSIGQQSKYVVVTDDGTLIFITSPAKLASSTIHSLVNNLQLIK